MRVSCLCVLVTSQSLYRCIQHCLTVAQPVALAALCFPLLAGTAVFFPPSNVSVQASQLEIAVFKEQNEAFPGLFSAQIIQGPEEEINPPPRKLGARMQRFLQAFPSFLALESGFCTTYILLERKQTPH